jgi:hypothetical protein
MGAVAAMRLEVRQPAAVFSNRNVSWALPKKHTTAVRPENFIRIDLATESPNVTSDGRADLLFSQAAGVSVQAAGPT